MLISWSSEKTVHRHAASSVGKAVAAPLPMPLPRSRQSPPMFENILSKSPQWSSHARCIRQKTGLNTLAQAHYLFYQIWEIVIVATLLDTMGLAIRSRPCWHLSELAVNCGYFQGGPEDVRGQLLMRTLADSHQALRFGVQKFSSQCA